MRSYRSVIDGKLKSYDTNELRIAAQRKSGRNAQYYLRINAHLRMLNWLIPIVGAKPESDKGDV